MTDSNAFFRLIWRLNALVILAFAGLGLFLLGVSFWPYMKGNDRGRPVASETQAPVEDAMIIPTLGRFERVGPPLYMASLAAWKGEGRASKLYGYTKGAPIINLVYLDSSSGKTRRLFADDNGLVATWTGVALQEGEFNASRRADLTSRSAATIIRYIKADTDGDKRLTEQDRGDLMIVRRDGFGLKTIAEGIDEGDSYSLGQNDAAGRAIFYSRGGRQFMRELDISTLAVGPEMPIGL